MKKISVLNGAPPCYHGHPLCTSKVVLDGLPTQVRLTNPLHTVAWLPEEETLML
jgi:hypothetical protein